MTMKLNSNLHWQLELINPGSAKYVTQKEFESFISLHDQIYELDSIHRDDTDFKTYSVSEGKSKLIAWADYYQNFFYIYE